MSPNAKPRTATQILKPAKRKPTITKATKAPRSPTTPTPAKVVGGAESPQAIAATPHNAPSSPTNAASQTKSRGKEKPLVSQDPNPKKVGALEAAAMVLAEAKQPMNTKEIYAAIESAKLWKTFGKTPDATLYAAIIREIASKGDQSRFRKAERGRFTLAKA